MALPGGAHGRIWAQVLTVPAHWPAVQMSWKVALQYLALPPGNTAELQVTMRVPAGTTIFEGRAAPDFGELGGGNQVYIPRVDPAWIVR